MPLVSVLLPSYNHAAYLGQCLDSVRAQTMEDWELIAVDDGSTDGSFELLRGVEDPRVKASRNEENLGTYGTLSRALDVAQGGYIAVLNSDDWWAPGKLALQVRLLEDNPHLQACYTSGHPVTESGEELDAPSEAAGWPSDAVQEPLPYLISENHVLASSVMFRRASSRFRPELRYSGDWIALLEPARQAPLGYVPEPLTFWRQHGQNTYRRSARQVDEEIWVRESILTQATYWEVPRLPRNAIRKGLSECALHLSALYVLEGRMLEARQAARAAIRYSPGQRSLRRLAVVSLSPEMARRRLWRAETALPNGSAREPLAFP